MRRIVKKTTYSMSSMTVFTPGQNPFNSIYCNSKSKSF